MPRFSKPVVEDDHGELIIPGAYQAAPGGIYERRSTFEWDNNERALINVDDLSVELSDDDENEDNNNGNHNHHHHHHHVEGDATDSMMDSARSHGQGRHNATTTAGESNGDNASSMDEEQGLSRTQPTSPAQQFEIRLPTGPVEATVVNSPPPLPPTTSTSSTLFRDEVMICGKAKSVRATWIRAVIVTTLLMVAIGGIVLWQMQQNDSSNNSNNPGKGQPGTYGANGDMFGPPTPGLAYREELGLQAVMAQVVVNSTTKLVPDWQSPFFQAMYWILYEDPLQLTLQQENGELAVQQRFLMASFYYTTSGQHHSGRQRQLQLQEEEIYRAQGSWKQCGAPTSLPLTAQAIAMNHNSNDVSTNVSTSIINPKLTAQQCTHQVLTQSSPTRILEPRPQSWRWLSAAHECDWAGVECNEQQQVTSIVLGDYGLTGTLMEELGFLSSLHTLSLPYNENLGGQVPSRLLGLLTVLDLQHNKHQGSLFDVMEDSTMLSNSSPLEEIYMAGNMLAGKLAVESMMNRFTNLRVLSLEQNGLTGNLPSISWPMLQVLRLNRNHLSGTIPTTLVSSFNLTILDLSQNADIVGTIPSEIGAAFNATTYLGLAHCQLTGTVPMELYSLTKLETIELQENKLQGTMASEIGRWSSLKSLNWRNNEFVGTLPTQLGNLKQIVDFLINGNDFDGTMPLQFCDMRNQTYGLAWSAKVVADCKPEDGDMDAAEFTPLVCPEGCCSSCCQKSTGDCTLDPTAILGLKSVSGSP